MILSDFLSRQTHNDSNPHEIIHIPFNMYNILYETYCSIEKKDQYLVQMWAQTKASRISLPEVHSAKKTLDTNVLPEKQKLRIHRKQVNKNRPRLGQGRAGIRCRKLQPVEDTTASTCKLCKIPTVKNDTKTNMDFPVPEQLITDTTEAITKRMIQDKNMELPSYPDPIYRPPPQPPENLWPNSPVSKPDTRPKIDVEFEENPPHQEGIISEFCQRPDKSYFPELKDLESLVNTGRLVQNFLPKQADIDKILKIIQWKVVKEMHLSVMVKEIQAGYLNISYFIDIYLYLAQNKMPSSKAAIRKVEALT